MDIVSPLIPMAGRRSAHSQLAPSTSHCIAEVMCIP